MLDFARRSWTRSADIKDRKCELRITVILLLLLLLLLLPILLHFLIFWFSILGWKWPRARVDHDSYNISHNFAMNSHRFWPKTQNGPPRGQFEPVRKRSPIAAILGSKRPRARVRHDPYNIRHDFAMISIVYGQKPKMALQRGQIGPVQKFSQIAAILAS